MKNLLLVLFLLLGHSLLSQIYPYDEFDIIDQNTTTFDQALPQHIHLDTSTSNIWQIGVPQKPTFNAAYSAPNALLTDTMNSYPVNNYSWFELTPLDLSFIGSDSFDGMPFNMFIQFTHRYQTDAGKDGGYITVSYDDGETWTNIINDSLYPGAIPSWEYDTLYTEMDTLFNGESGFSGTTNGWINTRFGWYIMPVRTTGDPMRIRFNFISDEQSEALDGWMIDNLMVYTVDVGGSISENAANLFTIAPNPVVDRISIQLHAPLSKFRLTIYSLEGKMMHSRYFSNANSATINDLQLPSGSYVLSLDGAFGSVSKIMMVK
jgi:hypothetical protein